MQEEKGFFMNYYELLEISPSASVEVIRNAYKTLAKKYHPDTYSGDTSFAEEKMKLLNEAVSVLEDEGKRNEYNRINGINSRYGKNNMMNFDENGESIFFSYDLDDWDDSDGSDIPDDDNASYMDIIDSFISNNKPDEKSKKKIKKNKEENTVKIETENAENIDPIDSIDDIVADISAINAERQAVEEYGYENLDNPDDLEDFQDFANGGADEIDFKTFNVSRNKSKSKNKKINWDKVFYIALAFLITGIVFFGAMIIRKVDLDNIKNLFSGKQEEPTGEDDSVGNFGLDDENIFDTTIGTEPPTTLDVEFITEILTEDDTLDEEATDLTEPAQPITESPTPALANNNAQNNPKPTEPPAPVPTNPPETKPPETEPPATEEPATTEPETTEEPTTEEPTEETTEPPTETEEETTEEPIPEETVAPPEEPGPEYEAEDPIVVVEPDDIDYIGGDEES